MRGRRSKLIATIGALALLAAGCSKSTKHSASSASSGASATSSGSPRSSVAASGFVPAQVDWRPCADGAHLDCATLEVPLDYTEPSGRRISLALDRIPAADPSRRVGSLIVNPGGPGASGVDFVKELVGTQALGRDVLDRFDIVGFDPRGAGQSTAVDCAHGTVDDLRAVDATPTTPAEQSRLDAAAKALADDCAKGAGDLLPHVGTDDTVRDIDVIRQAVGDQALTYAGFSYGTMLGLRYLALFPTHARAIYLDGVVDPTQDLAAFLTDQTKAFDKRVQEIFDACPASKEGCPDGGTAAAYDTVAERVKASPLPSAKGAALGPTALATAALYTTYVESSVPTLYSALAKGLSGDGTELRELADAYYSEGSFAAYASVECIDSPHPVGAADYKAFADELIALSPRFGGPIANELVPCAFWPAPVVNVTGPVRAPDGPATLVVGTTGDSATPYAQAARVAQSLVHGRLVTFVGSGHTSFGVSTCVRDIVSAYLVDGSLPAVGTTCRH